MRKGKLIFLFLLLIIISYAQAEGPVIRADRVECIMRELQQGRSGYSEEDAIDPSKINYKIYGADKKETIVLIHGWGGSLEGWENLAPILAKKYRVLVYDQRGNGLTIAPNENFSSTAMASDLNALLDHLHIKKAHILGHSMGGRTATRFAALFPEKTESLIVEDMHLMGRSKLQESPYELVQKIKQLDGKTFASKAAAINYAEKKLQIPAEFAEWYEILQNPVTKRWGFARIAEVLPFYLIQAYQEDLGSALRSIKAPKLFLAGDHPDAAEYPGQFVILYGKGINHIRENSPDAKLIVVPDSGHSIHESQTETFLNHVEDFLNANRQ